MRDRLTPIQYRMFLVLSDGYEHTLEELQKCLDDELAGRSAVHQHFFKMRKILRTLGLNIRCVQIKMHTGGSYVMERMVSSSRE